MLRCEPGALRPTIPLKPSQAFLTIYGTSGLVADGFPLFPTATGPTTVPLGNNTEIEVHRKRFIFTYPPKDLRAMILATPEPDRNDKRRKTLRMSMIASAMVFTPRPSQDPRENLRTLQSPLKPNYSSPLKPTHSEEPEEDDIVLVESNHPNVVQDDEDNLVILESVEASKPPESPRRLVQFTPQPHQYQTPRREPRNSLHRAVLIRSAQRTAMKVEIELEEEQEEMEVEDVVTELEETNLNDEFPEEVRVWPLIHVQPNINSSVSMTMVLWKRSQWRRKRTNNRKNKRWTRKKEKLPDHSAPS